MRLEGVATMPFTVRGMCVESDTETNTCVPSMYIIEPVVELRYSRIKSGKSQIDIYVEIGADERRREWGNQSWTARRK